MVEVAQIIIVIGIGGFLWDAGEALKTYFNEKTKKENGTKHSDDNREA
jgi:hypothetical protein